MYLFYSTDMGETSGALHGQEAAHCAKVLRQRVGDEIHVVDGKGASYVAEITAVDRNRIDLRVRKKAVEDPLLATRLPLIAFGILKNDTRTEWMIEKLVEIGVSGMIPLICEHSEKKRLRQARLEKIMISAMKQSQRKFLPTLEDPLPFDAWIQNQSPETTLIAHYKPGNPKLSALHTIKAPITLVIGPEGDFSGRELEIMKETNFTFFNLGDHRLRAETAAVTSCTLWNHS